MTGADKVIRWSTAGAVVGVAVVGGVEHVDLAAFVEGEGVVAVDVGRVMPIRADSRFTNGKFAIFLFLGLAA